MTIIGKEKFLSSVFSRSNNSFGKIKTEGLFVSLSTINKKETTRTTTIAIRKFFKRDKKGFIFVIRLIIYN